MSLRSKKTGVDLELAAMAAITRDLRKLPGESAERVANWVATQTWNEGGSHSGAEKAQ